MGGYEARVLAFAESLVGYHSYSVEILTYIHYLDGGQCQAGSLTGAVASQKVTEALKGTLRLVGNQLSSVIAEECLTARLTSRAGTKVGNSDPAVQYGMAVA